MNFREYTELDMRFAALIHIAENFDSLNEEDLTESVLKKLGLHAHKSKGILAYIKSFTSGAGKVFLHMIKGDLKKAKAVIQEVGKEDILDFLLKLDQGTLHLITGPIHAIDAWTGWHIWAAVKTRVDQGASLTAIVKDAIVKVKDGITKLYTTDKPRQTQLIGYVNKLELEL